MESSFDRPGQVWSIVLGGAHGAGRRPPIHSPDAPERADDSQRSLLRRTLDRVRLAIAPQRTVVVTVKNQAGHLAEGLDGVPVRRVLVQPEDKGTAASILLPAHWIHWEDPDAIVTVFPSDRFVGDEPRLVKHVSDVVEVVRAQPGRLVLVGAPPTEPEPDYGWIEPGEIVSWSPAGDPISRVQQFWENPSALAARACLEKGWLWNTSVLVARASLLLELGRQFLAQLNERLSLIFPFKDTELESWALRQAYGLSQKMNFSRAVLEPCPSCLTVSRLPTLDEKDLEKRDAGTRSLAA
jgi:mannose-1-phosphate guanylyltransferase